MNYYFSSIFFIALLFINFLFSQANASETDQFQGEEQPLQTKEMPSFDCKKANNHIEKLICGDDSDLPNLDRELAQLYRLKLNYPRKHYVVEELRRDQREWLAAQFTECKIPKGDKNDKALTGSAEDIAAQRSCLVASYQRRLGELSSSFRIAGDRLPDGFLYPSCLQAIVGPLWPADSGKLDKLSMAHCDTLYSSEQVTFSRLAESAGTDSIWIENVTDPSRQQFGYAITGRLDDGRQLAIVREESGGTAVENWAVAISQTIDASGGTWISATKLPNGGGDRCNGMIEYARPVAGGAEMRIMITPVELISRVISGPMDTFEINGPPIACVGATTLKWTFGSGDAKVVSLHLDKVDPVPNSPRTKAEKCVVEAVRKVTRHLPHDFDFNELEALKATYVSCYRSNG